jgi:hypothetical protein
VTTIEVTQADIDAGVPTPTCPECGAHVVWDFDCQTYSQTRSDGSDSWWACQGCDSAIEYICGGCWDDDTDCQWCYIDGLNPRNPRAVKNAERRPLWLPPRDRSGCGDVVPGVRSVRDPEPFA